MARAIALFIAEIERLCLPSIIGNLLRSYSYSLKTHLYLYSHVVIARHPFKLPYGLIFGHLAMGGVMEPLECDTCRVIMP
jgi:hypothetical protein